MWIVFKIIEKSIDLRIINKMDYFSFSVDELRSCQSDKNMFFHNHCTALMRRAEKACSKRIPSACFSSTSG